MAYQLEYTGAEVDRRLGLAGNIPTKVSDLTNDSGFITKSVNDLVNYYLKSETYTKAQVESLIAAISQFRYVVVATLPTASADTMNKIYLVPSDNPETQNVKDEYITLENDGVYTWEQIGSTAIDLSDYVTETQLNTALAGYVQKLTSVPEGNLAVVDSTGGIKDGGVGVAELKDVIAGNGIAAHLVDTQSAGTEQNFTFRQSGGDGVANYKTIKGRTLVWNQLVRNGDFHSGTNYFQGAGFYGGSLSVSDNILTITPSAGTPTQCDLRHNLENGLVVGHKYLLRFQVKASSGAIANISARMASVTNQSLTLSATFATVSYVTISSVFESLYANAQILFFFTNITSGSTVQVDNITLFDLTKLFGAGSEPSTISDFTALFPDDYYAYNAGTLLPFKGTGVKSTGVNQWDEQWEPGTISDGQNYPSTTRIRSTNYIPVMAGLTYFFKTSAVSLNKYNAQKEWLGEDTIMANTTFTVPSGCSFIRVVFSTSYGTTYNHDICINLSDPDINGQYFPYEEHTLSLPVVGKTAKDADGNAIVPFPTGVNGVGTAFDQYDKVGGKVVMAEIDLGELTWSVGTYGPQANIIRKKPSPSTSVSNMIMEKYAPNYNQTADKTFSWSTTINVIYVKDSSLDGMTGDQIKAALSGTKCFYELATPVPFTWDEPLCTYIPVDELGTEKLLPEGVDEDGIPATAPFRADTTYSISIANLVRKLNALSNE